MVVKEPGASGQPHSRTSDDRQPEGESEYTEVCPRCGQSFDRRILHQVIYHDQADHKPIALDH
jgi:hypothetical protein